MAIVFDAVQPSMAGPAAMATCLCDRHEDEESGNPLRCEALVTQEDFLCDACRPRTCMVFFVVHDATTVGGEVRKRRQGAHMSNGEAMEIIAAAAGWGV